MYSNQSNPCPAALGVLVALFCLESFGLVLLGLAGGGAVVLEEEVVVAVLLEPAAEVVQRQSPPDVDHPEELEDGAGLLELGLVELLLEQLAEVVRHAVHQPVLAVDQQAQVVLDHLFALRDEQGALQLDVVHLAGHLEGNDLALAFQAAQHAQVVIGRHYAFLPVDADARLVREVQPGDG